jgi:hypothetical protein
MRKRHDHTEFACFIKNVTAQPVQLSVPFGQMEARPHMGEIELEQLLEDNRYRYCASDDDRVELGPRPQTQLRGGFQLGEQEVL